MMVELLHPPACCAHIDIEDTHIRILVHLQHQLRLFLRIQAAYLRAVLVRTVKIARTHTQHKSNLLRHRTVRLL